MIDEQGFGAPSRSRSELHLRRREHGNVPQQLLALESHLALLIMGERFDGAAMLDAVDYLIEYVRASTFSAQHRALELSGAELYHRLDLAIRYASFNRGEVVRLGYAYCSDLRRSMSSQHGRKDG